ncbi:hypothetical protein [Streptomyces sp. NPDC001340]
MLGTAPEADAAVAEAWRRLSRTVAATGREAGSGPVLVVGGTGKTGAHIPETFADLPEVSSSQEMVEVSLEGHEYIQSLLFEVAVTVTFMIVAALNGETSEAVHVRLLDELISCVGGVSHWTGVEAGVPELEIDCRIAAREGLWTLYTEYATGRASMARMVLGVVDADRERFEYFDAKLIGRIEKRAKRH